jgi:hypothetical protein
MSSEKRRTSSDSNDAYARAVRREEEQQEREQSPCQDEKIQNSGEVSELDEASDLFRQHSHQQSMEGG